MTEYAIECMLRSWSRSSPLIGGYKTGDDRFYETSVPRAARVWEQYLAEQQAGLHDEDGEA